MAGFDYTNDHLIASIKRRGSVPTSQTTFTDDDFLTLADEELQTTIMPMIMAIHGEYFVTNYDVMMTSETRYPIPSDAIGLKLKDLYWVSPNNPLQRFVEIPQVSITDVSRQYAGGWSQFCFYIENNSIVLLPNSFPNQTLRFKYYKRASKLVVNSEGGQITAIDTLTNTLTLANVPPTFIAGTLVDGIDDKPGFETLASGRSIVSVATPNIILDDVSDLSVNDWICLSGESVIPQITVEAHPILAQSVVVKCLESLNDPGIGNAQSKLGEAVQTFLANLTPRVDAQPPKIVNRQSPLAWKKINRWWGAW